MAAARSEKIGYGLGDMSSSMFWKIFSYYLPFFYSNIFGLSLDMPPYCCSSPNSGTRYPIPSWA